MFENVVNIGHLKDKTIDKYLNKLITFTSTLLKIFVCVTVNGNVPKFMDGRDVAMDLIAIVANNVETLT